MKLIQILFLLFILYSCKKQSHNQEKIDFCFVNENIADYKNNDSITSTRIYGDTLKIITETKGIRSYEKIIDLKDGYTPKFRTVTVWKYFKNKTLNCKKKILINALDLNCFLCYDQIKKILESNKHSFNIPEFVALEELGDFSPDLIENKEILQLSRKLPYFSEYFLKNLDYTICDPSNEDEIEYILLGEFKTGYTGGNRLLIIDSKKDTIRSFEETIWMM